MREDDDSFCRVKPDVARVFLADIPQRVEALRGYWDAGDAKGIPCQAHTIKGTAAAASCAGIARLALALEQAGKAGDLESAKIVSRICARRWN